MKVKLRQNQKRGFATVATIALLTMMAMLMAANSKALFHLERHIDLMEQRQKARLVPEKKHVAPRSQIPEKQ